MGSEKGNDISAIKDYADSLTEQITNMQTLDSKKLHAIDESVSNLFDMVERVNIDQLNTDEITQINKALSHFHNAVNKIKKEGKVMMASSAAVVELPKQASRETLSDTVQIAKVAWEDLVRESELSKKIASVKDPAENTENLAPKTGVTFEEKSIRLENGGEAKLQSMHVSSMMLYHGSPVTGIRELKAAVDTTIGDGVYLTSHEAWAVEYAFIRTHKGTEKEKPTVYEVEIKDMTLLNLTTKQSLIEFMKFFVEVLDKKYEKLGKEASLIFRTRLGDDIKKIRDALKKDKALYPREILEATGSYAAEALTKLGYSGLFAIEGSEAGTGAHDSYVIFDPKKVKIVREVEISSE
jgi:hypothetical protein